MTAVRKRQCLINGVQNSRIEQRFSRIIRHAGLALSALCLVASTAGADDRLDGQLIELDIDTPLRTVYFLPNSRATEAVVGLTILAGEVDFTGPEGLSHYLEHLMFWHADKVNDQDLHARGGNAWVNGIVSSYYNSGSNDELGDLFEFTRRLFSLPTLDKKFMLDERKVVAREYDLRVSENPDWRIFTKLRRELYQDHPLSRSVIGTPRTIMSLTIGHAHKFHQEYYHPANAVLFVTGNMSKDTVEDWVRQKFSELPEGPAHQQQWRSADIAGSLNVTNTYEDSQVNHERLAMATLARWSGERGRLQDVYTVQMLQTILQSALPGSLAKPLRLDNFVVRGYELSIHQILTDKVEFFLWASPDEGVTLEDAAQKTKAALVQLAESGIPEKTIERVRKRWLQTEKRLGKKSGHTVGRSFYHLSLGIQPNNVDDHLDRIAAVSKQDIDTLLHALARPERQVTGLITGEGQ